MMIFFILQEYIVLNIMCIIQSYAHRFVYWNTFLLQYSQYAYIIYMANTTEMLTDVAK